MTYQKPAHNDDDDNAAAPELLCPFVTNPGRGFKCVWGSIIIRMYVYMPVCVCVCMYVCMCMVVGCIFLIFGSILLISLVVVQNHIVFHYYEIGIIDRYHAITNHRHRRYRSHP